MLLIACANVANLLLARGVARADSDGACGWRWARRAGRSSRRRSSRACCSRVAGGVAGLLVAIGAARLLLALAFAGATFLPIRHACRRRWFWPSRSALALVTGVIFGAAPAWFATRTDPIEALRGAGRTTGDHSSFARKVLLVVQATLSVVLVAGATMLARSLGNLEQQDFGFEVPGRVVVSLEPAAGRLHACRSSPALYRDARGSAESRCRASRARVSRSTTR